MTIPSIHAGPSNDDPLTADELQILLALPRAAKSSPTRSSFDSRTETIPARDTSTYPASRRVR
ncbi:hypothetical protein FS749_000607 [Ceratobasidium sp. UAMH 11750]|nr:hypothetical protein FS749_000607 [Ceratobasidium sp. UAMH 11750]